MRRKNLFKTLIILTALIWSVIVLTPTYMLNRQKQEADNFYAAIEENTTLNRNDIKAALSAGDLELQVRNTFKGTSGNSIDSLLEDVNSLIKVNEKIEENEPKSIKLGLDLQGGTYLVYEVDLPKMLETLAKERDSDLDLSIKKTAARVRETNDDFFDSVLDEILEKFDVEWKDLYPNNHKRTIIQTRDDLLHSSRTIDFKFLSKESYRLRSIIERILLRMLGWKDISNSPKNYIKEWLTEG